jgi:hypothetical protein
MIVLFGIIFVCQSGSTTGPAKVSPQARLRVIAQKRKR